MDEKKWYQSKKFATVIVTALISFGNETFNWGISEDQTLAGMIFALIYVLIQTGLDWYKLRKKRHEKDPIQSPMIREGVESLVTHYYDFQAADEKGINVHAKEVVSLVLDGLTDLVGSVHYGELDQNKALSEEIIRQVFKMYNQDVKMKEGAELVKRSLAGSAGRAQQ